MMSVADWERAAPHKMGFKGRKKPLLAIDAAVANVHRLMAKSNLALERCRLVCQEVESQSNTSQIGATLPLLAWA